MKQHFLLPCLAYITVEGETEEECFATAMRLGGKFIVMSNPNIGGMSRLEFAFSRIHDVDSNFFGGETANEGESK